MEIKGHEDSVRESYGRDVRRGLSHFPQKHRKFRANGFLTIRYEKPVVAKVRNILCVQKLNSGILW